MIFRLEIRIAVATEEEWSALPSEVREKIEREYELEMTKDPVPKYEPRTKTQMLEWAAVWPLSPRAFPPCVPASAFRQQNLTPK